MANGAGDSITPFITIWTQPRATIRRIVDTDPTRNVILLAAVGPGINALAGQWSKALSNNTNLSVLWPLWVAGVVVIQAALGVVVLYATSAVFRWSGGLLGGVASRVEVRAALAWSQVPAIVAEIILLIVVLMGVPMPVPTPGELPHIDPGFYKILLVEAVFGLWGLVISLKCIGEVHRFSAWRALVAILIPPLIVALVLGLAIFAFSRLMGHH
jgi:Yip1 domain